MHKALHPRDDIDRLYGSRKEEGRGLTSTEDGIDASIWQLKDDRRKSQERLITMTRNNTDNTRTNRIAITRKQKWEVKQLYGYFKWQRKYHMRKLGHGK